MNSLLFNRKIQKYTLIWLVYWLSVMGFNIFVLKPSGINFLENTLGIVSYFLFFAIFGIFLLRKIGDSAPMDYCRFQVLLTLVSGLLFISISYGLGQLMPLEPEIALRVENRGFLYPLLLLETAIGKYSDLIFQQSLIVSMVLFLKRHCKSPREVVEAFTIIFFVLHIPLFLEFGWLALIFIMPSLFAGAIFSFVITFYRWGVLFSMLVHQGYYIGLAILFRLVEIPQ